MLLLTNMRFRIFFSVVINIFLPLIMFDPKSIGDHSPVVIKDQNTAQVDSYRYLAIHIDKKLTWSVQVENVFIRVLEVNNSK